MITMESVEADLFSAKFPGAQLNIMHLEGKYISDSLTLGFLQEQFKRRLEDRHCMGMHRCFLVKAQMGKGKTTWVHEIVRLVMIRYNKRWCRKNKVLFLCNRNALSMQQIREAVKFANPYGKVSGVPKDCSEYVVGSIHLMTYHRYYELLKKYGSEYFSAFRIVVADEAHFFVADAEFNPDTFEILKSIPIVFAYALRIYMTATPEDVLDPIYYVEWMNTEGEYAPDKCKAQCDYKGNFLTDEDNTLPKLDVFSFPYSFSFINSLGYFQSEKGLLDRIISNNSDDKWIIFVTGKKSGKELYDRLINQKINTLYLDGESRSSSDINVRQAWERLVQEGKLTGLRVLICTKVLDNGFSIVDSDVKHVVIYTNNKTEFLQELGRIRMTEGQKINVYFPKMSRLYFRRRDEILYTFCKFYGSEKLPECGESVEIPMQKSLLVEHLIHSDDAIGYLSFDTKITNEGIVEIPRINDLVRWIAKCMLRDEEKYSSLLLDNPESAPIEYKEKWLKGDDNGTFRIYNLDLPPDEEAAARIEGFLGQYVDLKMREFKGSSPSDDEDEELFWKFSAEFQNIYLECFPDEKKKINTAKNRAPWKHGAIANRLKELDERQRDNEHFKLLKKYELVEAEGYWLLKGS